ncbi:MAG: heavy-metal-associated domain-containing protein [Spirosomataceae bacterium]
MKKPLLKTVKVVGYGLLGLFVAFVGYANLEPAPMHAYVKPISMAILKADGLTSQEAAAHIRQEVGKTPGVTACSANPAAQLVSITFDPDQTSAASLSQFVSKLTKKRVQKASFAGIEPTGPQCPVPLSYIMAFERLKYTFCFR